MADINAALRRPLRKIAKLAVEGESWQGHLGNPDLDLLDYRRYLRNKEAIVAFLRAEVEKLTRGKRSVRLCPRGLNLSSANCVTMAVVPAKTPEGEVAPDNSGVFVFAVCGAVHGYLTR